MTNDLGTIVEEGKLKWILFHFIILDNMLTEMECLEPKNYPSTQRLYIQPLPMDLI